MPLTLGLPRPASTCSTYLEPPPVPTLVILAHYDPHGQVAPHVDRHLDALVEIADRLLVVSTAPLTPSAQAQLEGRAELIGRANVGYDFYSWKTGLDAVPDWPAYSRLVLCNDSVIGPLQPLPAVVGGIAGRADFWGITVSEQHLPHVQSYVLGFGAPVLQSPAFAGFWATMVPRSSRAQVIRHYELGLSRLLTDAGFGMGSSFVPTPTDRLTARLRTGWYAGHAAARAPRGHRRDELRRRALGAWNPMIALWDRAVDRRLPYVKVETLRDDPYRLGRDRMLRRLECALPQEMDGVRDYLRRTAPAYTAARRRRG